MRHLPFFWDSSWACQAGDSRPQCLCRQAGHVPTGLAGRWSKLPLPLVSTSSVFIRLLEIDRGCDFSKGICVSLDLYFVSGPFSSREVGGGFGTPTSWDWGYQPGREAHLHTPPRLTCTTTKLQKPQTSQGWAREFSGEPDVSRVCGQQGWCPTPTWRKVSDDDGHPGGLLGETYQPGEGPAHPASRRVRI